MHLERHLLFFLCCPTTAWKKINLLKCHLSTYSSVGLSVRIWTVPTGPRGIPHMPAVMCAHKNMGGGKSLHSPSLPWFCLDSLTQPFCGLSSLFLSFFFRAPLAVGWHAACSGCFHELGYCPLPVPGGALSLPSEGTDTWREQPPGSYSRNPLTAAVPYASSTTPARFTAQREVFKAFLYKLIHVTSLSSARLCWWDLPRES